MDEENKEHQGEEQAAQQPAENGGDANADIMAQFAEMQQAYEAREAELKASYEAQLAAQKAINIALIRGKGTAEPELEKTKAEKFLIALNERRSKKYF